MRSQRYSRPHAIVAMVVLASSVLGPVGATSAVADEGVRSATTATNRTTAILAGPATGGETSVTVDPDAPGFKVGGSTISGYSSSHLSLLGPNTLTLEKNLVLMEASPPPQCILSHLEPAGHGSRHRRPRSGKDHGPG